MLDIELTTLVDGIAGRILGISTELVGQSTVRYAIETRQRLTGLAQSQYRALLSANAHEQHLFCQLLLISESWFEREAESITTALTLLRQRQSTVTILSAPCARGEEPISALYLAQKAGFALESVSVVGIDLSEAAIAQGALAEFSSYSFRGTSAELQDRFFDRVGPLWRAKPFVRERIALRCRNILDADAVKERFDLILCRNLLIYLDAVVQRQLIGQLVERLAPKGLLIVSAAEAPVVTSAGLTPHRQSPVMFTHPEEPTRTVRAQPRPVPSSPAPSPRRAPQPAQRVLRKVLHRSSDTPWELASRGYLEEAFSAALQQLEMEPRNAECYFLLGLISSSGGSYAEATEWFRQTLRIAPDHEDAQLMLQACGEREGEHDSK